MLVGITGNFGSGKTTFANLLAERGFECFDSDEFVSRLYERPEIIAKVSALLGAEIYHNGGVDKRAIAKIVFSDYKKLEKLNTIVHAIIREELAKLDHAGRVVFAEIPLLFEAQMEHYFDKIVLVKCPVEVALKRAIERGFSEVDFRARRGFQWSDEKKTEIADFIVLSDVPSKSLEEQADRLAKDLLWLAGK